MKISSPLFELSELVEKNMNEPPGARMRVGSTALTMAEYFRDINKRDVLLFIDNIFRFVQAGSEVSALLAEVFTGSPGKYVSLPETIKGFQMILPGELDNLPEQAFYLVGNIDEAAAKAAALQAGVNKSGQIGILPNHAPLLAALDMGVLKIRSDKQWSAMAPMGGFAMIDNNRVIILVNEAERASEIDPEEARKSFQTAQAELAEAEGRRKLIEANLTFKRAKARLEASTIV
ncbi:hypothetical protein GOP47_0000230 [Adiantum capillus-veneris]|uniref:H(+)-transporting two-sector ATPase n=1 Tax=Adiantum capillus-veneris TaxID=13818 RepID=A0A9D4VCM8_ADICA|nr:hypothetical protein GOP47_0000230 [Adiantum capillus-veneris]